MNYQSCFRSKEENIEFYRYLHTRDKQIAEMNYKGKTYNEIAVIMGLSHSRIKEICHKFGLKGPAWQYRKAQKIFAEKQNQLSMI